MIMYKVIEHIAYYFIMEDFNGYSTATTETSERVIFTSEVLDD